MSLDKKEVTEDEIEVTEIINFLWKKRKTIILMSLVLLGFALVSHFYTQRKLFYEEGEAFSSLNIDRMARGVYRLRARIFGQENDANDDVLAIDFDRDFDIIITESGELELLALTVESQLPGVEVTQMRISGRLRNRVRSDEFNAIRLTLSELGLREGMRSREFPISVFTINEQHEIQYHNMDLLSDIAEFREYFVLDLLEMEYYHLLSNGNIGKQRWYLRYTASQDLYELFPADEEIPSVYDKEIEIDD